MSSASMRAINSPRARPTASFNRHASPLASSCRTIRMRGSPNAAARAALSSRDPSSMRTSSQSASVCQIIERIAASTVAALSRIDMIIDTTGIGERPFKRHCLRGSRLIALAQIDSKSTFAVKETPWKAGCSKRSIATRAPGDFKCQPPKCAPEKPAMREFSACCSQ
jgi:hypothetical protein